MKNRHDPRRSRVFVIVSRQVLIDSNFSTVICAPTYAAYDGLSTQVSVGVEEGLKHQSSIHCDELISIRKSALSDFVGRLNPTKKGELDRALVTAVGIR
jgi:mRNA interferase MazF